MDIRKHEQKVVEEEDRPLTPNPEIIAKVFANHYYQILQHSPELIHRFYKENSKLGRPEADGTFCYVTTVQAINEKILSLGCNCKVEVKTIDAHDSFDGGVMILLTGSVATTDNLIKKGFVQSFFLAPQDIGYYVLNDMFRFTEDSFHQSGVKNPMPEKDFSEPVEQRIFEKTSISKVKDETSTKEVFRPSENEEALVIDEGSPTNHASVEFPNASEVIAETSGCIVHEEKKSYASIVKITKENIVPLPSSAPQTLKHVFVKTDGKTLPVQPPSTDGKSLLVRPPSLKPNTSAPSTTATFDNGEIQESQAGGFSIYVDNLPMSATVAQLTEEFKRFGPIKNAGIRIRNHKRQQLCFAFIEFEEADAVQSAIEASPVIIGGYPAQVEEKHASGSRRNKRECYASGRGGGFRKDTVERDYKREE